MFSGIRKQRCSVLSRHHHCSANPSPSRRTAKSSKVSSGTFSSPATPGYTKSSKIRHGWTSKEEIRVFRSGLVVPSAWIG
mmetsp:Transcript_19894/g.41872  ORF Transcript_19894/g.41872 Transcript_19894/m.41872 type:complete len:80 (-) Transcript_19894:605-844(-)